jgi:hypothetical protein
VGGGVFDGCFTTSSTITFITLVPAGISQIRWVSYYQQSWKCSRYI